MQLCREGKEKEQLHSGPRQPLYQLQRPARRAPALGDQHLPCLPWRLGPGSGVAQKRAAVELKPSSRWAVGGGAGCHPAACGAENCCCLFSFFERKLLLDTGKNASSKPNLFFFDTSSKPNLVMGWIGKFSVHAEREGRPVSFPSKSSMGQAGLNARRRDKQRKLAKT